MERREKNIILLSDLSRRGVRIENVQDFEKSIFADVYSYATTAVEKIVQTNRYERRERIQEDNLGNLTIPNVISFIGRRGTGKTSAMMSFRDALELHGTGNRIFEQNRLGFSEKADMNNVRFFSLNYLDASILENSEDIFLQVLANMFNYMQNMKARDQKEFGYRNLLNDFSRLYEAFYSVKNGDQSKSELYSPFEQFLHMASSQDIRKGFANLVKDFLEYIRRLAENVIEECYLVITIDDLDMAYYNGETTKAQINNKAYEIINSIQKYLSVPGVIVLTAYNHVNLMAESENFFFESDSGKSTNQKDNESQRMISTKLSNQFIDKAFSLDYRVYLPSWKKSDFQKERFQIDVKTGIDPEINMFLKYFPGRQYFSVKRFILTLYAFKIGVYYDCEGKKVHFLEPDSLRRLSNIVSLFSYSDSPLEQEFLQTDVRRKNLLKIIKRDIYFRFIQESLFLPEEKEFFNDLMELRIDRRGEAIVRNYAKYTGRLGKRIRNRLTDISAEMKKVTGFQLDDIDSTEKWMEKMNDNSDAKYSFAELVHVIYHMTRAEAPHRCSKELVACILHSYSIYLSEIYDRYRENKKTLGYKTYKRIYKWGDQCEKADQMPDIDLVREIEEDHEILQNVIGDTVCGKWCEYYFPGVYVTGFTKDGRKTNIATQIIGCTEFQSLNLEFALSADHTANEIMSGEEMLDRDMQHSIKTMIFFFMLYTDVLDWKKISLGVLADNKGENFQINIKLEDNHNNIEMTAFFRYAFLYKEFLNQIARLLMDAIKVSRKKIIDTDNSEVAFESNNISIKLKFLEKFHKNFQCVIDSLWDSFCSWDKNYGTMMLPIHNFDLTYNMMKHIFQECQDETDAIEIKQGEDFWRAFDRMLRLFERHLERVDSFYGKTNEKRNFKTIFQKCPFLTDIIKPMQGDLETNRMVEQFIKSLIISVSDEKQMETSPEDN